MMNENNIEWLKIGGVIVFSCCADADFIQKKKKVYEIIYEMFGMYLLNVVRYMPFIREISYKDIIIVYLLMYGM